METEAIFISPGRRFLAISYRPVFKQAGIGIHRGLAELLMRTELKGEPVRRQKTKSLILDTYLFPFKSFFNINH